MTVATTIAERNEAERLRKLQALRERIASKFSALDSEGKRCSVVMPPAELAFHKVQLRKRELGLSNAPDADAQMRQLVIQENQLAEQLGVKA